jgi:hypothetical protein
MYGSTFPLTDGFLTTPTYAIDTINSSKMYAMALKLSN